MFAKVASLSLSFPDEWKRSEENGPYVNLINSSCHSYDKGCFPTDLLSLLRVQNGVQPHLVISLQPFNSWRKLLSEEAVSFNALCVMCNLTEWQLLVTGLSGVGIITFPAQWICFISAVIRITPSYWPPGQPLLKPWINGIVLVSSIFLQLYRDISYYATSNKIQSYFCFINL